MDVALFGAAGYSGLELIKLLAVHPHAKLVCAASDTNAGKSFGRGSYVTTHRAINMGR